MNSLSNSISRLRADAKKEARAELLRDALAFLDRRSRPSSFWRPWFRSEPSKRKRRKPPIQLCPVPRCKNRAAPVFGMVCAAHKGLPKSKIRKYREARRAKKVA